MKTATYEKRYDFKVVPEPACLNFTGHPVYVAMRHTDTGDGYELGRGQTRCEAAKNAARNEKFFRSIPAHAGESI